MPAVKFCGLTSPEDASQAARLGAAYAGVIFAGGPRLVSAERAREIFAPLPPQVRRVGVFGSQSPEQVAAMAAAAMLDVVQLHVVDDAAMVTRVRHEMAAAVQPVDVWAVVRVADGLLPDGFADLAAAADAVVMDSLVTGALGGTGVATDWRALAHSLSLHGRPATLVLAGGLNADNVYRAIELVAPDAVDVSSGVEVAGGSPGHKDHARMRAFANAVAAASIPSNQTTHSR